LALGVPEQFLGEFLRGVKESFGAGVFAAGSWVGRQYRQPSAFYVIN
jgi:hypothetical protein